MQKLQGSFLKLLASECVEFYVLNKHPELTVKNLKNFLGRFLLWLHGRELTVKECRTYVKDMERRLEHSSASSDTGRLQMFLKWLHYEKEVTETDWARDIRRPKKRGYEEEPEVLISPEKMIEYILIVTEPGVHDHILHREAKKEHRDFLLFYCKMGLRPNEAIKIDYKKVNLDGNPPSVHVLRKGGKWRNLGLPLDYLEPIRQRVEAGRWFKVSQTTCQRYMRQISKLAGKKIKLYSIRKSVDTGLLDEGAGIMHAAEHQGHTVAIMQRDYVKFSAKQSSEVNNTYNPYIDRSKLPVQYMLPKIDKVVAECSRHKGFKVQRKERKLIIEW
jgi:site-specific recombinase XerD